MLVDHYYYARDNPEAIAGPTGHDWWSSATSFVSNVASTVSSDAGAVASAAEGAWNSLPPTDQVLIVAGAVTAVAVAATVLTAGAAAPVAADAIASEAADVAVTEGAAAATTEGSTALSTMLWNTVGGAASGAGGNVLSDIVGRKPITVQDVTEGALLGALGGALSGGASVAFEGSMGPSLLAQVGAGIGVEFTNIDIKAAFNHTPVPSLWEAAAFGAAGGLVGAGFGAFFGPTARGIVFGAMASGAVNGIGAGLIQRLLGTSLTTPILGPVMAGI